MRRLLLTLALLLAPGLAWAQNPTCPTRPPGDSTNACASTAFVQQATNGSGTVFTPEQFGAPKVCNPSLAADTPIASAITAAKAASATYGTATLLFQCNYKTTNTVTLASWLGTINVQFPGSAGFNLNSSANGVESFLVGGGGPTLTFTNLTGDLSPGVTGITVASTAAFHKGDYIALYGSTGIHTYIHLELNRIASINSSTSISLERVVEFPVTVATAMPAGYLSTTPYIQLVSMETGKLVMDGGTFDGTNSTGTSTGLELEFLADAQVSRIRTSNFTGTGSQGYAGQYLYQGSLTNFVDNGSGNAANSSAALNLSTITGLNLDGFISNNSPNFGILIDYMNGSSQSNVASYTANGRGVKFWSNCGNYQINITANQNLFTGIDYDSVSLYNQGFNFKATSNGNEGLAFLGTGSQFNWINGVNVRLNTFGDVSFFGSFANDINNTVTGLNNDANVTSAFGGGNNIVSIQGKSWANVNSVTNTSVPNNSATSVVFDTVVIDPGNQYNTSTNTFTVKFPGVYNIHIVVTFSAAISISSSTTISTAGTTNISQSFVGGSSNTFVLDRTAYLSVGDTVTATILQQSGSTQTVTGASSHFAVTQQ